MAGDMVACGFYQPCRRGRNEPDLCRHPQVAGWGPGRPTGCLGFARFCFDKQAREAELERRRLARVEADRPVSVLVRLARMGGR